MCWRSAASTDSPGARRKHPSVIHSPLLQEEPDVRSLLLHDFLADERHWLEAADGGWGGGAGGKKQHHIRGAEGLCREGDYPGPTLLLPGGYSPAPGPHCKKTQREAVSRDSRHISGSHEEGDEDAALRGEGSRGVVPVPGAEREVREVEPHVATVDGSHSSLICSLRPGSVCHPLTEEQRMWPAASGESTLSIRKSLVYIPPLHPLVIFISLFIHLSSVIV